MSNEENSREMPHELPPEQGGWQPIPHGGEYDAEATAFLQLPPEGMLDAAPPGSVGGGVPPHCSTREDWVNSPDSSGRSPSATGIDHWPVTSCPGAGFCGERSSKAHCPVAPGLYVNRSPCVPPVAGSCHWAPSTGAPGTPQEPVAAGSVPPSLVGETVICGGT